MGKGTYGNKRGRPPMKKTTMKRQSATDKLHEAQGMKGMKKGMKSKSRKGDKDFTTKKGDKDFHEKGKDVKKKRSPYQAFVSKHRKAGKSMKEIGSMWRKTKK